VAAATLALEENLEAKLLIDRRYFRAQISTQT
jgi:hypothetical protein